METPINELANAFIYSSGSNRIQAISQCVIWPPIHHLRYLRLIYALVLGFYWQVLSEITITVLVILLANDTPNADVFSKLAANPTLALPVK